MTDMIIYGKEDECEKLLAYADNIDRCHVKQTEHYDTFLSYLSEKEPSAVFILTDGADGMEGVIAAKNIFPAVPIVWISDDKGFGAQSYRLGCVFFTVKPLKERSALMAFSRIEKHRTNRHADAEESRFSHLTHDMIKRISHTKTAEEMVSVAQKHSVLIDLEEAKKYFRYLSQHELDDDLLENVSAAGGIENFKFFFDAHNDIE